MAGHSHWAGIKHKKAVVDAKRGKLFSRLAKEIIIAARQGGGNPDANISLRNAIDRAKSFSMPNANIERADGQFHGDADHRAGASRGDLREHLHGRLGHRTLGS